MSNETPRSADGTQPAEPSSTFADPLSGLAGSGQHDPATTDVAEAESSQAARRQAPDPETVRSLLGGVFAPHPAEGGQDAGGADNAGSSAPADGEPVRPVERPPEDQRPGMLPSQRRRTWPSRQRLTRQAWRPRRRSTIRRPRPAAGQPRARKPTRGSAGVAIAIALLVLFCFVALQFIVSLLDMFSGIGG